MNEQERPVCWVHRPGTMTDGTDGALRGKDLRREAYALLADGVTVLIRPARPGDCDIEPAAPAGP